MKCLKCEFLEEVEIGMNSYGKTKKSYICNKEPEVGKLINGDTKGYSTLYASNLNQCSPKWCPKRNI